MNKVLEVSMVTVAGGMKMWITKQSHRRAEFGAKVNEHEFHASNGVEFASYDSIEWRGKTNQLFVRGDSVERDSDAIVIDMKDVPRVLKAIAEYNAFDFEDGKTELEKAIEAFGEHAKPLRKLLKFLKMPTG